jgi:spore coat polysaccharide biosynthesis protein SpsF
MIKKNKIVGIIEVRMSSTRLPGKAMKKILGKPVLELLIERVKRAKMLDSIVVATSTNLEDKVISDLARKLGVEYYRGSLNDVLSRIIEATKSVEGDIIVEITGDCPLVDPEIVDKMVNIYLNSEADYVSNVLEATYPAGMDVQVFSVKILEEISKIANTPEEREHGSWLIYKNPETTKYKLLNVKGPKELFYPHLRLMVDYIEDFELISKIFENLYLSNPEFNTYDIINLLENKPELKKINSNIKVNVFEGQKIAQSVD